MAKKIAVSEMDYTVPAAAVAQSARLMAAFDDVVQRTCDFSKDVGDVVRGNPDELAELVHSFARITSQVFRRWNLEILYLLSVENGLRFSQVRAFVPGINGRSLSLKLDEMEQLGLIRRAVSNHKPPQVTYSLTEQGRKLTRLSFPMVLQLNMELGLREKLTATKP